MPYLTTTGGGVSWDMYHRDSVPNRFMVLMKFRTSEATAEFYRRYNGKAFSSLEVRLKSLLHTMLQVRLTLTLRHCFCPLDKIARDLSCRLLEIHRDPRWMYSALRIPFLQRRPVPSESQPNSNNSPYAREHQFFKISLHLRL